MKINGINILDIGMLKQNFSLSALFSCVDNGTLLTFEESLPAQGSFLTNEVKSVLISLREHAAPDFLREGKLVPELLRQRLLQTDSSFIAYTSDTKTGLNFFDRSWAQVTGLAAPLCTGCSNSQAWRFYLCILLHLQACPKLPLRQADVDFIAQTFSSPAPARQTAAQPVFRADRLCLCGKQLLFLSGGSLYAINQKQPRWHLLCQAQVQSYACTPSLGLITVYADGTISAPVRPDLCKQAEGKPIQAVAAYGDRYVLLTQDGCLLSNLKLPPALCWQQVLQLHLGLNSLSCISGKLRGGLQYGSDPVLHDFTGICSLYTRTDGARRYAVLRESGDLHVDWLDEPLPQVQAACLSPQGCFYAAGDALFLLGFDGTRQTLFHLPEAFRVQEICAEDNQLACLGVSRGQERILTTWQPDFLPPLQL